MGTINKTFNGHLVIDWRNGSMKVSKRKPKNIKPFEVPIELKIKMVLPEQPKIIAEGEIEIPPNKVKEMFIQSI